MLQAHPRRGIRQARQRALSTSARQARAARSTRNAPSVRTLELPLAGRQRRARSASARSSALVSNDARFRHPDRRRERPADQHSRHPSLGRSRLSESHRAPSFRAWLDRQSRCALIRYGSSDGLLLAPPSITGGSWRGLQSNATPRSPHSLDEIATVMGEGSEQKLMSDFLADIERIERDPAKEELERVDHRTH